MIQGVIKCFERSTVERIKENSNDVSRCLIIRLCSTKINTHKYGHGEMRNKKLINKRNDITQDGSFPVLNIALEKEGEKRKKSYYNTGYLYLVTHPSTNAIEQGLTLWT